MTKFKRILKVLYHELKSEQCLSLPYMKPFEYQFRKANIYTLPETDYLEFKESLTVFKKHFQSVTSAFLNAEGGKLVTGIADNGTIKGVKLQPKEKDIVKAGINDSLGRMDPPIDKQYYKIRFYNVYDSTNKEIRDLFVFEVAFARVSRIEKDVFFTGNGRAYVRVDGNNRLMKSFEIRKIHEQGRTV